MNVQAQIRDIYADYNEPLRIINAFLKNSPKVKLLVNVVIMLVAGIFLITVLFAISQHGLNPKIDVSLYIVALALLLLVDLVATDKELSDLRGKRKKLTLWTSIPFVMFLFTVYILLQQIYRWKVLHKKQANFNVILSGFKVLVLFGITFHSGVVVFKTISHLKKNV